jgi:hypothetical protein
VDTQTQVPNTEEEEGDEALLLDFSQAVKRTVGVARNGEAYEVRNLDEFGLAEEHELRAQRARFTALQERTKKLSPNESAEHARLLSTLFEKVVVASPETMKTFSDREKQKVLVFFTAAQLGEEAALNQAAIKMIQGADHSTTES